MCGPPRRAWGAPILGLLTIADVDQHALAPPGWFSASSSTAARSRARLGTVPLTRPLSSSRNGRRATPSADGGIHGNFGRVVAGGVFLCLGQVPERLGLLDGLGERSDVRTIRLSHDFRPTSCYVALVGQDQAKKVGGDGLAGCRRGGWAAAATAAWGRGWHRRGGIDGMGAATTAGTGQQPAQAACSASVARPTDGDQQRRLVRRQRRSFWSGLRLPPSRLSTSARAWFTWSGLSLGTEAGRCLAWRPRRPLGQLGRTRD